MKRLKNIQVALGGICLIFINSCSPPQIREQQLPVPPPPKEAEKIITPAFDWVETTLQHLTLEEKAAQLVHVWTTAPYYADDDQHWQEMIRLASQRKIGGFIFSVGDVYETAIQINKLQAVTDVPLLIGADYEYGAGMRVRRATSFPSAMAIGATRNTDYAYAMAKATAREGRALGIHQNYAPTVDINLNPRNPVINTRSYGDDVQLVSTMAAAYVRGTQEGGMLATAKHFPGHGDTDVDTHLNLVTLNSDKARLMSVELAPYRAAFEAGLASVMVGHIAVPKLDSAPGIPATLSPRITTDLLQKELCFSGLIVTDAMEMKGVAMKYGAGESAVLALKAGVDLILMPVDADVAIDAIVDAVRKGELSEERLNYSVRKLLRIKERFKLHQQRYIDPASIAAHVNIEEHRRLALKIARDAVTVLGNQTSILPLQKSSSKKILDLVITESEDLTDGKSFHTLLNDRTKNTEFMQINSSSNKLHFENALASAARAELIILQFHLHIRSGEMTGFVRKDQRELVAKIAQLKKSMIGISFGNPYIAMDLPTMNAYVCAYSDDDAIEQATAEIVFGESESHGKLPITIPGMFKYGDGVELQRSVLRTGFPEEAGFSSQALRNVDQVIQRAIRDSAFPGAVLAVARNGMLVYHKAYGKQTYETGAKKIQQSTIYDLASVTKVITTTSAVMKLVGEGKIRLGDPVVKYIPQFGQQGKQHITLYNLMVHNSGLPAWRRFYDFCDTPACVLDSIYATPLIYRTGDSSIYSDLGLITMGKIIERVTNVPLDRYVDSVFFKPLGMMNTMYNPPQRLWNRIAPTEVDTFWRKTGKAVQGTVHDENCSVLGGVSGHAGLFSTASDLTTFLQMILNGGIYGGERYLERTIIDSFTKRQSLQSTRGIGWDTKNHERSWAGNLLSDSTFLHTGFTGTSVAVDPEKNLIIVFLTNRVYPTRENSKISRVRPEVHDVIAGALIR
ncbi:MAG: glycoside hydrolase family 3 N-terminal domain-containing protein [bacterium]